MLKMIMQASAIFGLAIGASMVAPVEQAQATSFAQSCGGLNQKTCISANPAKWCDKGLTQQKQQGRNICVRKSGSGDTTGGCGGLNQKTCISANPAKWCDKGLTQQRQNGRNICVRKADLKPGSGQCGGLNQVRCKSINPANWCEAGLRTEKRLGALDRCVPERSRDGQACGGLNQIRCKDINPAKWCDKGLRNKVRWGQPDICINRVTNKDRLEVAGVIARQLGANNPLTNLANCIKTPSKLGDLKAAITDRSNNGVNRVLRACNADMNALRSMGSMAALNNGKQAGSEKFFKSLSITVGAGGAAVVAGAAGAGIAIELKEGPNARWFFTGGVGAGPKAKVVGDVSVGLSRSEIPTNRVGFDNGIAAVVSGHWGVGLSAGVEFEGNTLDFSGLGVGVGGGVGLGGAVYKTGAIFPFKDR